MHATKDLYLETWISAMTKNHSPRQLSENNPRYNILLFITAVNMPLQEQLKLQFRLTYLST